MITTLKAKYFFKNILHSDQGTNKYPSRPQTNGGRPAHMFYIFLVWPDRVLVRDWLDTYFLSWRTWPWIPRSGSWRTYPSWIPYSPPFKDATKKRHHFTVSRYQGAFFPSSSCHSFLFIFALGGWVVFLEEGQQGRFQRLPQPQPSHRERRSIEKGRKSSFSSSETFLLISNLLIDCFLISGTYCTYVYASRSEESIFVQIGGRCSRGPFENQSVINIQLELQLLWQRGKKKKKGGGWISLPRTLSVSPSTILA